MGRPSGHLAQLETRPLFHLLPPCPVSTPFPDPLGYEFNEQVLLGPACLEHHRAQFLVEIHWQPKARKPLRDVIRRYCTERGIKFIIVCS
jgi:hypothetical protein